MATQNLYTSFLTDPGFNDLEQRINKSAVGLSVALCVAGLALFGVIFTLTDKGSALSMALMVAGTALLLYGIFKLIWHSKEMVYTPTDSVAQLQSTYFDTTHLAGLTRLLEQSTFSTEMQPIESVPSGNVRLDWISSRDHQFAAVQLFQYVPYTYTPVSEVRCFTGSEAAAFLVFLDKCKR